MEQVALNNVQLDYVVQDGPQLKLYFYGTVAYDRLPKKPDKKTPRAYIVNMDPHNQPFERYEQATPLRNWIVQHWKYVTNGKSLQFVNSKSCGDYVLLYLKAKACELNLPCLNGHIK